MKKKIIALCLCIAMIAIAVVSGTLAYFTDEKTQTNTFTAGKLKISLDEAELKVENNELVFGDDGNLVLTGGRTSENQTYKLFPGMKVTKDPTITLLKDSEDAYIAAKITIKSGETGDIESLIPSTDGYMHMLDVSKIISGGLTDGEVDFIKHPLTSVVEGMPVYGNTEYFAYQEVLKGSDNKPNGQYIIYMFVKEPVSAEESVVLFDTLTIDPQWDHDEMAILNEATIQVEAYATQANGFDECYKAMAAAFKDDFPVVPNP